MNFKKIVALFLFAMLIGSALCDHTAEETFDTEEHHLETRGHGYGRPTQKATAAPTQKATTAPTQKASSPTTKATAAPTQKASTSATAAPTQKASSGSATNLCSVTAVNAEPIQILVPLYVYPGAAWDTVANAAKSTGVKTIAIINPNSGPDPNGPDSSYVSYMSKLTAAGVDMVGYVHSTYAGRSSAEVYADIDKYATKYPGLKGIFIDEASALAKDVPYYTGVYNRIISKAGYTNAILNPGTQPDQGYLAISTNIVIFENAVSTLTSTYATWVKCAPTSAAKTGYKYKFSGIGYAASNGQISSVVSNMVSSGMGLVYVTDGAGGCCTYNNLASYYATMASAVKAING